MPPVVRVVVPEGIDDPRRPSGGNTYDRRLCEELVAAGWEVEVLPVTGAWPVPDEADTRTLCRLLQGLDAGSPVLVDGLVASGVPGAVVPAAERLPLVVLLHLPLGLVEPDLRDGERAVLRRAAAVVTTSAWSRDWVRDAYGFPAGAVSAVLPGTDPADPAPGTASGEHLLCVGAVTPAKGHADLLAALTRLADRPWVCRCVGTLDRDPGFVDRLRREAAAAGLANRFVLVGPVDRAELAQEYAAADALVTASRLETYGMVATEALARGLPVLASDVGGLPEAVGRAPDGTVPGLLVPPNDVAAWVDAVDRWLGDGALRNRLRASALARRGTLVAWDETARGVARVLAGVAA